MFLFSIYVKMKAKNTNRWTRVIGQPSNRGTEGNQGSLDVPWCQTAFHPRHHPLVCEELFGSQEFGSQDYRILSLFGARRNHTWIRGQSWGGVRDECIFDSGLCSPSSIGGQVCQSNKYTRAPTHTLAEHSGIACTLLWRWFKYMHKSFFCIYLLYFPLSFCITMNLAINVDESRFFLWDTEDFFPLRAIRTLSVCLQMVFLHFCIGKIWLGTSLHLNTETNLLWVFLYFKNKWMK